MDLERAKELVSAERDRVNGLLSSFEEDRLDQSASERDAGDTDGAQLLERDALAMAVGHRLKERLSALDRAERRIADGTYGVSVESGLPIPDDRLEIDPAAELTVGEAAKHGHS